jgi:hypothetical protein
LRVLKAAKTPKTQTRPLPLELEKDIRDDQIERLTLSRLAIAWLGLCSFFLDAPGIGRRFSTGQASMDRRLRKPDRRFDSATAKILIL